jgi:hypothetical protein
MTTRLTPDDLAPWRCALRDGRDGEFDTTLAHQLVTRLMGELEMLWAERGCARAELMAQAAAALEAQLRDLERRGPPNAPGYGCVHCRDSEASSFITYWRGMAAAPEQRG